MGCGSSSFAQVYDAKNDKKNEQAPFQSQLFGLDKEKPVNPAVCYLFGQTSAERKIVCFHGENLTFNTISSRVRIPNVKVKIETIQQIYQQSQQIIASNLFADTPKPPFNRMLGITVSGDRIFLCGGINYEEDQCSNQAYLFNIPDDPVLIQSEVFQSGVKKSKRKMNRFQSLPKMQYSRYSHMGVFMPLEKGTIFIFGGKNQKKQTLHFAEKYIIHEKKWKEIPPLQSPRSDGCSFVFMNKIYIFGGQNFHNQLMQTIEVFNPSDNKWQVLPIKLHRGIKGGLIVSPQPNQILLFGGCSEEEQSPVIRVNLIEESYRWQTTMKMTKQFLRGCKINDKIFIFGGTDNSRLDEYDLKTKEWRKIAVAFKYHIPIQDVHNFTLATESLTVQIKKTKHKKVQQQAARVVIFGNQNFPCILNIAKMGKKFYLKIHSVPMNLKVLSYMNCVKINEGGIFIAGGFDNLANAGSKKVSIFDPESEKIQQLPELQFERYAFGIESLNQAVYIFGGFRNGLSSRIDIFDLYEYGWKKPGSLTKQRSQIETKILNECEILLFGGKQVQQKSGLVEIYSTAIEKIVSFGQFRQLQDPDIREIFVTVDDEYIEQISKQKKKKQKKKKGSKEKVKEKQKQKQNQEQKQKQKQNQKKKQKQEQVQVQDQKQKQKQEQKIQNLHEEEEESKEINENLKVQRSQIEGSSLFFEETKNEEEKLIEENSKKQYNQEQYTTRKLVIEDIGDEDLEILVPNETGINKIAMENKLQSQSDQQQEQQVNPASYLINFYLYKQIGQSASKQITHLQHFQILINKKTYKMKVIDEHRSPHKLGEKIQYSKAFEMDGKHVFLGKRITTVNVKTYEIEHKEIQGDNDYWKLKELDKYTLTSI